MAGAERTMAITMPRQREFIAAAKMAVGALSAQLDLPYHSVKDIQLGLEEACLPVDSRDNGDCRQDLSLRFCIDPDKITVYVDHCGKCFEAADPPHRFEKLSAELAIVLLEGMMDEVSVTGETGHSRRLSMVKRRRTG